MKFYGLFPVNSYCSNCGHKNVGYKARDQTVRTLCERCRLKMSGRQKDKHTIVMYLTAPNDDFFDWN